MVNTTLQPEPDRSDSAPEATSKRGQPHTDQPYWPPLPRLSKESPDERRLERFLQGRFRSSCDSLLQRISAVKSARSIRPSAVRRLHQDALEFAEGLSPWIELAQRCLEAAKTEAASRDGSEAVVLQRCLTILTSAQHQAHNVAVFSETVVELAEASGARKEPL